MKDITGYEGLYAVTSCGKVWSHKNQKFLKPILKAGYLYVGLSKDGKHKYYRVHRLVAQAYVPNDDPENKTCVNHRNEIKTNNYIKNLEWISHKDNTNYGTRNQRIADALGKPVYCLELDRTFDSLSQAARELNLKVSNIGKVVTGRRNTTGGYHWKYL